MREAVRGAILPELDPVQCEIVSREPLGSPVLVAGAPGSGKTTTAVAAFLRRVEVEDGGLAPSRHVILAPTRQAAARLRDVTTRWRVSRGGRAGRALGVHTPSALAFGIVRQFAVAQGMPSPTLITGAQQDQMLADLLAGHGRAGGVTWPGVPPEAVGIPAFRDEVRNLFMRAAEFGLTAAELAERGRVHARPEWAAAAALLQEYRDVVSLADLPAARGERYDSAAVISEAATVLADWEDFTDARAPRIDSVIVDDYQEASAATVRLLHALRDRGAHLTLFADPDVAVQAFRGARPQFVGRAGASAGLGGFGASMRVLPVVHRGGAGLRRVVAGAAERVPVVGVADHRRAGVAPGEELEERERTARGVGGSVEVVELGSEAAQAAWIARCLRSAHLHDGLPWTSMAVIVRSSGTQRSLVNALRGIHVPVVRGESAFVLSDEPAVRALLVAMEAAASGLDAARAVELLSSPIGGLDSLSLRRVRRELHRRVRSGEFGEGIGIDEALAEVLASVAGARTLPPQLADGAVRVARVLAVARSALAETGASHETVLWEAWDATGLAALWRERALAGGPAGERADEDLDAVMALFTAAENFAERNALAGPLEFVRFLRAEAIPSDTLAARGVPAAGVQVLTAAQAAGQEWDLVVVAGVQEDEWPDTRVRDTLLGANRLADVELGRIGLSTRAIDDHAAARADVLADEWRVFTSALSRARERLVVTAVRDEDRRPSRFFDHVGGAVRPRVPGRLDLRGVVAALRAELDAVGGAIGSAALLAVLAGAGVQGAEPTEWAGVAPPSTRAALKREGQAVHVSPSRVEMVTNCPLRWALETSGGRGADRIEQSLGSLVHEIASEFPHGSREEVLEALERRFPSLGLADGWISATARRDGVRMLSLFADYASGFPGEVRTEVEITQQVGDAVVHGFADRLESVDDGVRVVDLKTGNPVSQHAAETHAQLAMYQLALEAGGDGAAGARLVYLTPDRRTAAERHQPALPRDGGWARETLDSAVDVMRGGSFAAAFNGTCTHCPVRSSCPVSEQGARCAK